MSREKESQIHRILSIYDRLEKGEKLVKKKNLKDFKRVKNQFNVILIIFEDF